MAEQKQSAQLATPDTTWVARDKSLRDIRQGADSRDMGWKEKLKILQRMNLHDMLTDTITWINDALEHKLTTQEMKSTQEMRDMVINYQRNQETIHFSDAKWYNTIMYPTSERYTSHEQWMEMSGSELCVFLAMTNLMWLTLKSIYVDGIAYVMTESILRDTVQLLSLYAEYIESDWQQRELVLQRLKQVAVKVEPEAIGRPHKRACNNPSPICGCGDYEKSFYLHVFYSSVKIVELAEVEYGIARGTIGVCVMPAILSVPDEAINAENKVNWSYLNFCHPVDDEDYKDYVVIDTVLD